jgi:RNA polymerase sigma-70 factor (ECF subfamily)
VPHDPAADRSSLLALRRDDPSGLNQVIERWQRPLLGFAYRYVQNSVDAQDLVAETFVRLHRQRERLRSNTNLSAWLFTALTNLCHNHYRWKRRHPTHALDDTAGELRSAEDAPDAALAQDESLRALRAAVERLPHDLRVAVLLHHYEHLSYQQIAEVSGCSERGVETRLYRARQQLKKDLAQFLREASPC